MPMRLFTLDQVAQILGATDRDVRDWMAKGWLPFQRLSDGMVRVSERAIVQFLRDRGVDIAEILAKIEAREATGQGRYEPTPPSRTLGSAAGKKPISIPAQTSEAALLRGQDASSPEDQPTPPPLPAAPPDQTAPGENQPTPPPLPAAPPDQAAPGENQPTPPAEPGAPPEKQAPNEDEAAWLGKLPTYVGGTAPPEDAAPRRDEATPPHTPPVPPEQAVPEQADQPALAGPPVTPEELAAEVAAARAATPPAPPVEAAPDQDSQTDDLAPDEPPPAQGETTRPHEPAEPPEGEPEPQPISGRTRQIAEAILDCAVRDGATEAYLQPGAAGVHLRMRIDGVIGEKEAFRRRLPADVAPELDLYFRALAGAHETAAVWAGRAVRTIQGRDIRLDLSSWPTLHGPAVAVVLRDARRRGTTLGELGLPGDDETALRALLAEPGGLIVAAGPTPRDTFETLRAMLLELAGPQRHVVTVERSVDVEIDGVLHARVDRGRGFGFAEATALLAAQHADVILVERLRDPATALAALDAAENGAMVLAGMQAASAPSAVETLLEMGCEPWPLAAALRACVAQTTVRALCPHCKQVEDVDDELLARLGLSRDEVDFPPYAPGGCRRCFGTGYAGTLPLFSVMVADAPVRAPIRQASDAAALRRAARAAGMRTLLEAGLEQARLGLIPLE